jgi:glycosyltransferase involved in cell wall biosynthesis
LKHSICITTLNDSRTLDASLSSLFSQIDRAETEVVVVDSESTDGSTAILRKYEARGMLRLVVQRCSVGMGRQLAFLNSKGDYILAYLDTDDIFRQNLREILTQYHAHMEGLTVKGRDFLIIPREAVNRAGGWPDTHTAEDLRFLWQVRSAGIRVVETDWSVRARSQAKSFRGPFRVIESTRRIWDMTAIGLRPWKMNRKWRMVWLFILVVHRVTPRAGLPGSGLVNTILSLEAARAPS